MTNLADLLDYIKELFSKTKLNHEFYFFGSSAKSNNDFEFESYFLNNQLPFKYSYLMLEYQNCYFSEKNNKSSSFLLLFKDDEKIIGHWPLSVSYVDDHLFLSSFGYSVLEPFFLDPYEKKYSILKCVNFLLDLKKSSFFSEINIISSLYSNGPLKKYWDILLSQNSVFHFLTYELNIDLLLDLSSIKSNFRKSYKSIINKKNLDLKYEIYDYNSINHNIWHDIKRLHFNVSGRQTRSDNTWNIQYEMVKNGNAFVITIYKNQEIIAGSLFGISNFDVFYFIGAYNRSMVDLNLGHHSIFMAILKSKELNLKNFCLGTLSVPCDQNKLTDKELSIEHFKKGFSSDFKNVITYGLV